MPFFLLPRALVLLGVAFLAGGCATSTRFQVDASHRSGPSSEPRFSYRLVSANPDFADNDTLVRRMARAVGTALSSHGLFEAPQNVAPQLEIEFDFGIEGPRLVLEERVIRKSGPEKHRPIGGFSFEGSGERLEDGPDSLPEERTVVEPAQLYRKFLRVSARPAPAAANTTPALSLWSVFVENEDRSNDLEDYITLMAAAAMDVLGEDTTTPRTVTLTRRDGRVLFVQTGIPEQVDLMATRLGGTNREQADSVRHGLSRRRPASSRPLATER